MLVEHLYRFRCLAPGHPDILIQEYSPTNRAFDQLRKYLEGQNSKLPHINHWYLDKEEVLISPVEDKKPEGDPAYPLPDLWAVFWYAEETVGYCLLHSIHRSESGAQKELQRMREIVLRKQKDKTAEPDIHYLIQKHSLLP